MDTKHTPGPWWSERDEHDTRHVIRAENVEHPIANVNSYWRGENCPDRVQREANSHLIAAAPELLEAADHIDRTATDIADDMVVISGTGYRLLRAAIAKATQP